MEIIIEKKFLEGSWWKWGAGLAALQICAWLLLGYYMQESFDPVFALTHGMIVWGGWVLFAFLPFVLGRLGLKKLYACGLFGFGLGILAYYTLAFYTPVRVLLNGFLPFIAYVQLNTALLSLGLLLELGAYVYRKVIKE